AALKAGLSTVPVIVKDVDDRARQEIALIENIQREDLNVLEEAEAYQGLIERFSYTQEEVSKRVGKSRTVVTNSLRLLKLSSTIKADLLDDKVSMGHARAYLGLDDPLLQQEVHRTVIKKGLSVRQTEDCVKRHRSGSFKTKSTKKQQNTSEYDHVVEELRKRFATKIDVSRSGKRGKIVIEFFSGDDFERIYDLLRG
ncbi:MAG: ParB/RepB/Spo0J family partition protein, partial [Deltaproteobacteria bacterium]|nr:ParB/RepB/Spo0J family partition protein [Deltaproteobacteria bacterium]